MHFRCRSVGTQRKHTACMFFYIWRTSYASILCVEGYSNVHLAMHFRCRSVGTQRKHTACMFLLFFCPLDASIKGKRIKEIPPQVRVFALAGAIGIEPTQWESEAQVLPLHQAPSRELLYITKDCFAIDFLCRNKKITAQMIFFEIIDLFLLQK